MATEQKLPDPEYERKFNSCSTALEVLKDVDLSDKTILITGTTAGIGIETARSLAIRGAHIVMANRQTEHRKIDIINMDLTSLQSVQAGAKEFLNKNWPLHVLILNAGIMTGQGTIDNLNAVFQTNHLSHFYLTHLLRNKLIESAPSRVVVVASNSHRHTMIKANAPLEVKMEKLVLPPDTRAMTYLQYAVSKLCNVLFAFKLHRELHSQGVSAFVLHPGSLIPTSLGRGFGVFNKIANVLTKPFTKTLEQGAATTVYCAAAPGLEKARYFENCFDDQKNLQQNLAHDEAFQDALWNKSLAIVEAFEKTQSS
ncbi:WW domain-containing oxidoreductase [Aphelenchoides bicaudatus]|nr:WW domain-containing oxidoreductase [Aphelenchoides bicaudatus]